MPRDQTDPNIAAPTIEDVPVTEGTCQRRTGEIMAIQKDILTEVQATGNKLDVHVAIHKGSEKAMSNGMTKRNSITRTIGLYFVIAMGIGGLIWGAAKLMNQPNVSEIVKAVIEAQKNP